MTITKVEPKIATFSEDGTRRIELNGEHHDVPFGSRAVDAFCEGNVIREAVAQHWSPKYSIRDDEGKRIATSNLQSILHNVRPQGILHRFSDPGDYSFPIKVRIILDYPLQEHWDATVSIPAFRFGEIFSIAHDMYQHIYDLDNADWMSQGHQDSVPRRGNGCMNRAKGKHVWGHDMSDLFFESVMFTAAEGWPKIKKRKMKIIMLNSEGEEEIDKDDEDEFEEVLAPLTEEDHKGKEPFVGTILFGIGS